MVELILYYPHKIMEIFLQSSQLIQYEIKYKYSKNIEFLILLKKGDIFQWDRSWYFQSSLSQSVFLIGNFTTTIQFFLLSAASSVIKSLPKNAQKFINLWMQLSLWPWSMQSYLSKSKMSAVTLRHFSLLPSEIDINVNIVWIHKKDLQLCG